MGTEGDAAKRWEASGTGKSSGITEKGSSVVEEGRGADSRKGPPAGVCFISLSLEVSPTL